MPNNLVKAIAGLAPAVSMTFGAEGSDATFASNANPLPVAVVSGGTGGGAVTIADGADVTQGAKADAAWSGSGSGSVIAILKALWAAVTGTLSVAGPASAIVGTTITRPADTTPYASGDLVANSTTAASVTPLTFAVARQNAGTGAIVRARLSTNKTGLAGTEAFRLHLFKLDPTLSSGVANGDNGAFSVNGVAAIHLGLFDFVLDRVFRDGAKGIAIPAVGGQVIFDAAGGTMNIFGLLEARGAYTPASGEVLTVALEVLRD